MSPKKSKVNERNERVSGVRDEMGVREGIHTHIRGLSIEMIPNTMNAAPILPSTANEWRTWGPGPFRYLVEWWQGMNQIDGKGDEG